MAGLTNDSIDEPVGCVSASYLCGNVSISMLDSSGKETHHSVSSEWLVDPI